jgi:hypothetical protein
VKNSWLDVNMGKFISRTLLVFVISTGLFYMEKIGEDNWTYIAMVYIGTTKAKDFAILRWGKRKDDY